MIFGNISLIAAEETLHKDSSQVLVLTHQTQPLFPNVHNVELYENCSQIVERWQVEGAWQISPTEHQLHWYPLHSVTDVKVVQLGQI